MSNINAKHTTFSTGHAITTGRLPLGEALRPLFAGK